VPIRECGPQIRNRLLALSKRRPRAAIICCNQVESQKLGWLTAQDGYAIFEASSKDQVLGMVHSFYPFYRQEIHEIVPWEQGKQAILASARQAASRVSPKAIA
jgi:hypothetical protein